MKGNWDLAVAAGALLVSVATGYLNFRYTKSRFDAEYRPRVKATIDFTIKEALPLGLRPDPGSVSAVLEVTNQHDHVRVQDLSAVLSIARPRWGITPRLRWKKCFEDKAIEIPPSESKKLNVGDLGLTLRDFGLRPDDYFDDLNKRTVECYRLAGRGHLQFKASIHYESPSGLGGSTQVRRQLKPTLQDREDGKPPVVISWEEV
jgi:hypothetical protein